MELDGARTFVLGATGVLGGEISRGLAQRGARLVLAGTPPRWSSTSSPGWSPATGS